MMKVKVLKSFTGYPDSQKAVSYVAGATAVLDDDFVNGANLVKKGLVAVAATKKADPE